MSEAALRAEIVRGCRVLYRVGIGGLAGHLSARLDDEHFLIKPRRASWLSVTEDDLIVLDLDGQRVDGPQERTAILEWPLHALTYRARPDVGAVMHAHPLESTLLGALDVRMEPLTKETTQFAGRLPVHENLDCLLHHNNLIVTAELGEEVAATLGTHDALLLRSHGSLVVGRTVGDACLNAYNLEVAARTMLQATSIRPQPIVPLDRAEAVIEAQGRFRDTVARLNNEERWRMLQDYYLEGDERSTPTTAVATEVSGDVFGLPT